MEQAIAGGILLAIFYLVTAWVAAVFIWALRWVILGVLCWGALGILATRYGWAWGDYVTWSLIGPPLALVVVGLIAKLYEWLLHLAQLAFRVCCFFSKKISTPAIPSSPATQASPAPGQRVFHARFGNGKVLRVEGDKLTISFDRAGEKKVAEAFVEVVLAS
jgi:hypothetical protein